MEKYLVGVIPSEMPSNYPLEALKAQAVAARSEAMRKVLRNRHGRYGYQLCDDVCCQTYRGASWENNVTNRAVSETNSLVIYGGGGKIVDAVYCSCCGGATQSSSDLAGWGRCENLIGVRDGKEERYGEKLDFLRSENGEYCAFW
jgi:stage II sporulation protein D